MNSLFDQCEHQWELLRTAVRPTYVIPSVEKMYRCKRCTLISCRYVDKEGTVRNDRNEVVDDIKTGT